MYQVVDEYGRVWKTFNTDKEANDYVRSSPVVASRLSVQFVNNPRSGK